MTTTPHDDIDRLFNMFTEKKNKKEIVRYISAYIYEKYPSFDISEYDRMTRRKYKFVKMRLDLERIARVRKEDICTGVSDTEYSGVRLLLPIREDDISDFCLETNPCIHKVQGVDLSAIEIAKRLTDQHQDTLTIMDGHFHRYGIIYRLHSLLHATRHSINDLIYMYIDYDYDCDDDFKLLILSHFKTSDIDDMITKTSL